MDSDALQDRCVTTLDMLHVTSASLPVTCATLAVQYCARMVSFPFTSSTCRAANFSSDLNLTDRKSWLNTVNTCLELTKWKYRYSRANMTTVPVTYVAYNPNEIYIYIK